ncbi:MAG: hypothetical protein V4733_08775 [Verrucomicrobiota bacterium]
MKTTISLIIAALTGMLFTSCGWVGGMQNSFRSENHMSDDMHPHMGNRSKM